MNIEIIRIGQLIPYPDNPKAHPPEQVERIAESIKEFGFRIPILVDSDDVVVAGHGRLLAARKLGLREIPVIRCDDLTTDQIRAFRIADNRAAESHWIDDVLASEVLALSDLQIDRMRLSLPFEDVELTKAGDKQSLNEGLFSMKLPLDYEGPVEPEPVITPRRPGGPMTFFVIVASSVREETYMRDALGLEAVAPRCRGLGHPPTQHRLTVEEFKKRWESRTSMVVHEG